MQITRLLPLFHNRLYSYLTARRRKIRKFSLTVCRGSIIEFIIKFWNFLRWKTSLYIWQSILKPVHSSGINCEKLAGCFMRIADRKKKVILNVSMINDVYPPDLIYILSRVPVFMTPKACMTSANSMFSVHTIVNCMHGWLWTHNILFVSFFD